MLITASIEAIEADGDDMLTEQVADSREAYPDVPVRRMLGRDGSARVRSNDPRRRSSSWSARADGEGSAACCSDRRAESLVYPREYPVAVVPRHASRLPERIATKKSATARGGIK